MHVHAVNAGSELQFKPPPATRRDRALAERRQNFLRAAAQMFGEKGYHGTSIAEIAGAAEYGTGTIYLHFKNKEELYMALLEEKTLELTGAVKRQVGHDAGPWEAIQRAVRAQFEFYDQNRTFFQSFVRERLEMQARLHREKWARVTRAYERFLRYLTQLIRRGQGEGEVRPGDCRLLAVALSGMVNQLTRDGLRRHPSAPLVAQAGFVADLFRFGAARPGAVSRDQASN